MTRGPLGRVVVLTDRAASPRPLPETVAAAVRGGAGAVVLREKDLPAGDRAALAEELRPLMGSTRLVLAGPVGSVVHLAAADALPSPRPALVGRSCHDRASLVAAAAEGCDWVTLSPVWQTASKPGYGPALGPAGLAALIPGAPPVYALGGVDSASRVAACRDAGAAGVAVMGAVMRADDPQALVAELVAAW